MLVILYYSSLCKYPLHSVHPERPLFLKSKDLLEVPLPHTFVQGHIKVP